MDFKISFKFEVFIFFFKNKNFDEKGTNFGANITGRKI